MIKEFDVIVEKDADGYYVASVPELHGCHTQARSLDKLMQRVQEAIALCIEVEGRVRIAHAQTPVRDTELSNCTVSQNRFPPLQGQGHT